MARQKAAGEEKAGPGPSRERTVATRRQAGLGGGAASAWLALQRRLGNRTVQRLLAQRAAAAELDDETAARINRARGVGQPLDSAAGSELGAALGHDFSDVRVHTSPEADSLNRALQARAFTTGQDVFFRAGAYEPHSSGGRQLLAHELTHVVQQSGGTPGTGRMTVNPPGDAYEREADGVAQALAGTGAAAEVQRKLPEEEEEVQFEPDEALQRQEDGEEEWPE